MAENTKISWCDYTFNPLIGCQKVSPGCDHCYAESLMDTRLGKVKWGPSGTRVMTSKQNWSEPERWNAKAGNGDCPECNGGRKHKTHESGYGYEVCERCNGTGNIGPHRRRVFCASLADVFEDWQGPILDSNGERLAYCPCGSYTPSGGYEAPICNGCNDAGSTRKATMDDLRDDLFRLIDSTQNLDWLLLTKRPENIQRMWPATKGEVSGLVSPMWQDAKLRTNVWLGTTVESERYLHRIEALLDTPAPVHFVSCEPQLESIDFRIYLGPDKVNWLITGGESKQGKDHEPAEYDIAWTLDIIRQCHYAGISPFVKQLGSNPVVGQYKYSGERVGTVELPVAHPKGEDITEWPADLQVQEFPENRRDH